MPCTRCARRRRIHRGASAGSRSTGPGGRHGPRPLLTPHGHGVNTGMLRTFPRERLTGAPAVNGSPECAERLYRRRTGRVTLPGAAERMVRTAPSRHGEPGQRGPCGGRPTLGTDAAFLERNCGCVVEPWARTGPTRRPRHAVVRGAVGQRVVPTGARLEQRPEAHQLPRHADGHHGAQAAGTAEERDELALVERALGRRRTSSSPPGFPSTWRRMPYWSDQKYGTGVKERGVRPAGHQAARRRHPRFGGHLPVLDPDELLTAVVAPVPPRDVPRRHDAVGGEQPVVAHDAVLERSVRSPPASPVAGTTPMPTTTTSAGSASPPASSTTSPLAPRRARVRRRPGPADALHRDAGAQLDTVGAVQRRRSARRARGR